MNKICIAQQPDADRFLSSNDLALVVGALLDQQVPMEWAFTGPYTIAQRLKGDFDANTIATYDPDAFAALMSQKPAVHRYPGSMATRIQKLCQYLVDQYDGDVTTIWNSADSGKELLKRLKALPGFGPHKAQVFVALLGKQRAVRPEGWREAAEEYGQEGSHLSAADVTGPDSLHEVRASKTNKKTSAKRS